MKNIPRTTYIWILSGILIVLFFALLFFPQTESRIQVPQNSAPTSQARINEATTGEAHIMLEAGGVAATLPFSPGNTLYEILNTAQNAGTVSFSGKNYPELGFFITDIGTLHQGNGKFLLYFVNGTEMSVGISSYTPKDGDTVVWKLQ